MQHGNTGTSFSFWPDWYSYETSGPSRATGAVIVEGVSSSAAFSAAASGFDFVFTGGHGVGMWALSEGTDLWTWDPAAETLEVAAYVSWGNWTLARFSGSSAYFAAGHAASDFFVTEGGRWERAPDRQDIDAFGGGGNDTIYGGQGNQLLSGDAGDDVLFLRRGTSTALGGAGRDAIHGDTGIQILDGGDGPDTLWGGMGAQVLMEGAGADLLLAGTGAQTALGGIGADTIRGGSGMQRLMGEAGADRIEAGAGNQTLTGGSGRDTFVAGG